MAQNFLSPIGFRFSLRRTPNVEYYIQAATLPSLTLNPAELPTPFARLYFSADHLEFSEFSLTFRVDEDMSNYREIYNWMIGIAFPDNFTEHKNLVTREAGDTSGVFSDATLTILNSTSNPNITIQFEDVFPTNLSEITFDVRNVDVVYAEATVTFRHKRFTIETI